jgi:uncharacterized membrane protein
MRSTAEVVEVDNDQQDHGDALVPLHWRLAFGGELILGAILGSLFLATHSLFLDETVSATLATVPWHRFTDVVEHREPNQGLYYLILRGWVVFGHSEAALRSLSVLAAVGALAVVILVTRELFGQRVALLCGLLLAIDPLYVQFAQDVRGYSMCLLLVSASSLLFVRGIQRPQSRPLLTWGAYALITALAAYTNFWAALVPLAHAASLLFLPRARIPWRRLVPAAVALVVLLVPLALLIQATDSAGVNWASGSSAGRLITRIRDHVPHAVLDLAVLMLVVVVLGIVLALRRRPAVAELFDRQWPLFLTLCWLVVPVAAVVLLSLVDKPLLVVRYLMVSLPPAVIVVALLIVWLWDRLAPGRNRTSRIGAPLLLVVALVFSMAFTVQWYDNGGPQDFRSAVTYLAHEGQPGDGVLMFAVYERMPVEWYLRDYPEAQRTLRPVFPSLAFGVNPLYFDGSLSITKADVLRSASKYHRVWFVLVTADKHLYTGNEASVQAALRSDGFAPTHTQTFRGVDVIEEVRQ